MDLRKQAIGNVNGKQAIGNINGEFRTGTLPPLLTFNSREWVLEEVLMPEDQALKH